MGSNDTNILLVCMDISNDIYIITLLFLQFYVRNCGFPFMSIIVIMQLMNFIVMNKETFY
jgi:hypothetical protein